MPRPNKLQKSIKKRDTPVSARAIAAHPDPDRRIYFNDADYDAACARIHGKRVKFDAIKKW